jgi:hypothetical protein
MGSVCGDDESLTNKDGDEVQRRFNPGFNKESMMQEKNSTLSSSLDLPFLECHTIEKDSVVSYMLSVRLEDYWKFVSDENGHMRRCLFDSDSWDFLEANQVNENIANTLSDPADLLTPNNVVTILATHATVIGKTIQLQDIQIINGLLTTKNIYHHVQSGSTISNDGDLPVQIIVSSDAQVRYGIIEATSIPGRPLEIADLQVIRNRLNSA